VTLHFKVTVLVTYFLGYHFFFYIIPLWISNISNINIAFGYLVLNKRIVFTYQMS